MKNSQRKPKLGLGPLWAHYKNRKRKLSVKEKRKILSHLIKIQDLIEALKEPRYDVFLLDLKREIYELSLNIIRQNEREKVA